MTGLRVADGWPGALRQVTPCQPVVQAVWAEGDVCWCTSDHWVYRLDYASKRLSRVFRMPMKGAGPVAKVKDTLARSWLRRRLRPAVGIDNLVVLPGGEVVLVYDQVYWYSPKLHGRVAEPLECSGVPSLAPPLRGGMAVHGGSGRVYFGEYLNGHSRAIRVACVDVLNKRVHACWEFSRADIKHIHAVHYDPYRRRLWICTGDLDHESAFFYTDDEFQTVHKFAGGDQTWRAIAMWFDEDGMEWGMDAGKDAPASAINKVFRFDFASNQRRELIQIGNPAYAVCQAEDGSVFLQTSFEPGRKQSTESAASIWHRGPAGEWRQCVVSPYRADRMRRGGQYGALLMPAGRLPAGRLLLSPSNAERWNGSLLELTWAPTEVRS